MDKKEYLRQAYYLDKRIEIHLEELESLRELAGSVSSLCYGKEKVQTSINTEAPFVKALMKLMDLEEKIGQELSLLIRLKEQVNGAIEKLTNSDEQMVLLYRYFKKMTWDKIGQEIHVSRETAKRIHANALRHFILPKNPISIADLKS